MRGSRRCGEAAGRSPSRFGTSDGARDGRCEWLPCGCRSLEEGPLGHRFLRVEQLSLLPAGWRQSPRGRVAKNVKNGS